MFGMRMQLAYRGDFLVYLVSGEGRVVFWVGCDSMRGCKGIGSFFFFF